MLWMSVVGIAMGLLNASSEMVMRQFFSSPGNLTASELDVIGLISMQPLFQMRQLADLSWILLVAGVAFLGSNAWKARLGIFFWIIALATLVRLALLRFFIQWPSNFMDMDLIWSLPSPIRFPAGLIIGVAILSLIFSMIICKWAHKGTRK